MSECVVRMEMPENCQRCELFVLCTEKCENEVVRFDGKNIDKKDRRCLFICQLPEGHGDLVDKQKLLEKGIAMSWSVQKWVGEVDIVSARNVVPAERSEE